MADALGVDSSRGVVRFVAVAEADLATGGRTVAGEIEVAGQWGGESVDGEGRGRRGEGEKRSKSRKRVEEKARSEVGGEKMVEVAVERPPVPPVPTEKSGWDRRAEKVQKVGRRKSFLAMFGR